MRIVLSTVALVGLAQATSLTSQAEIMTEAGYINCPQTIFPPDSGYPTDENVIMQAKETYDCQ